MQKGLGDKESFDGQVPEPIPGLDPEWLSIELEAAGAEIHARGLEIRQLRREVVKLTRELDGLRQLRLPL